MSGLMAGVVDAPKVDASDPAREHGPLLSNGEEVQHTYRLSRDGVSIFTDRRLILVDKQGMTGKKVVHLSIPYRSIVRFSVETPGTSGAELKIWTSGDNCPITKQSSMAVNIYEMQALLAEYVCAA